MADGVESLPERRLDRRDIVHGLWPIFRPHLPHFLGALALLILASILTVLGPVLVKRAIDVDIASRDATGLTRTVVLYCGVLVAHLAVAYAMRIWLEWTGQAMIARLKRRLFDHLMHLPLRFYDRQSPGKLIARVESDTDALRLLFTSATVLLVGDFFLMIAMFVVMFTVSARLTLTCGVIFPIMIGITLYFRGRTHAAFLDARRHMADVSGRLAEFVQGMPVLRAFERRQWAVTRFREINRRAYEARWKGAWNHTLWMNDIFLTRTLAFVLILGLGGWWSLQGLVTIGTLVMFMSYVRRFFEPIFRLSEQLATMQRALAASERILLLLTEPIDVSDPVTPVPWPGLRTSIRFENVWFRYGEGPWILEDVSFEIRSGERWAVVGPTGAGKSTIVSLLLRFYDPQRGRVTIDGVDVRELTQHDLRRHVGLVLQDVYLFPGSLRDNVLLGRALDEEALARAAGTTMADQLVARLPGGWETDLSERGANLSMGERQLISFTRAIAGDPELIILDEATSAIDPATEAFITESLTRALRGRTAVIIAHRLATVRECDRILVLDAGRVVAIGRHETLVEENPLYRRLATLQLLEAGRAG